MIPLDNHDDILAAIRQLAGMKMAPASPMAKKCGCTAPCDCEVVDEETEGAPLANTPADPIELLNHEKNLSVGNTQDTGHTPEKVLPTRGAGDNPYLSEGDGPDDTIMIDGQAVDKDSIEIDGVDTQDYPDFADAFISSATFTDWTPLTTKQLDQLQDEYPELVHELAHQSLNEDLDEGEGSSKAVVGAIIRRIVNRHPELLSKYGPKAVTNAVEDVAIDLNDLEEIGTSDVSIWTQRVIDDLERQGSVKAPELDENEINTLAESLARDWQKTKLENIAENFNVGAAERAISEGKNSYTHGHKTFAIRKDSNLVKVFPVLEGRVMTQVPLYIAESNWKKWAAAGTAAAGLAMGSNMLDNASYTHNPNIVRLEKQLAQTSDPAAKAEIEKHIHAEKAFQDAKGRPRVAPGHEKDVDEGWNDRLDPGIDPNDYIDRMRDHADQLRKEKKEGDLDNLDKWIKDVNAMVQGTKELDLKKEDKKA